MTELSDADCDRIAAAIQAEQIELVPIGVRGGLGLYRERAPWPPPARGTHESDEYTADRIVELHNAHHDSLWSDAEMADWFACVRWSRTLPPPAPGTHSSSLANHRANCPCGDTMFGIPGQTYPEHCDEYALAAKWSAG